MNLHKKLEEYILVSFYSNLFSFSSLEVKNWDPYTDSLGRIRVKSATLRICDLQNLFTDCPPLCIPEVYYTRGPTFHSFGSWLANTFLGSSMGNRHTLPQSYHNNVTTSRESDPAVDLVVFQTMYFYTRTKTIISSLLHLMEGWTEEWIQAHTCSFLKEVF